AAHWYCPPNIPEHQFKAEIQGHFSITQEGKKLPNYSARSNYDDYAIGDGQGNRDGRLGIKLGQVEGLQMIEAFRSEPEPEPDEEPDSIEESDDQEVEAMRIPATYLQAEEQEEQEEQAKNTTDKPDDEPQEAMTEPTQKAALKRPGIYADDLDLMNELMLKRNVTGTPAEVFRALLETFITETSTTQKQHIETVGEVAQTLNWFTDRINRLEQERDQLRQERDRFQAHQGEKHDDGEEVAQLKAQNEQLEEELQQITSLKARNTQLEEELQQTKAQLNGIQQLLGGKPQPVTVESPAPTTSPVMATTSPDQTLDVEKSSTKQRSRAESTDKIADVIDAIIKWNTAQERSEMRLRISFPSVKSLALLMGAGYQPAMNFVYLILLGVHNLFDGWLIASAHE
ncbi:MAG: hypothetical protein AAFX78_20570, partial [Cyanobacteria bacterium J06638_20]